MSYDYYRAKIADMTLPKPSWKDQTPNMGQWGVYYSPIGVALNPGSANKKSVRNKE